MEVFTNEWGPLLLESVPEELFEPTVCCVLDV
jgi:hypothetical protein